jgi:hypothetical protein
VNHFAEIQNRLEQATDLLEDAPDPKTDAIAILREQVAEALAQARRIVAALAAEEGISE